MRPEFRSLPAPAQAAGRGPHHLTHPQMNTIRAGFTLHRCRFAIGRTGSCSYINRLNRFVYILMHRFGTG